MENPNETKTGSFMKEMKELRFSNFFFLTIAGIINAFGVTIVLFPVKLYDSGISGLSMLLDQITPAWLSLSVFLVIMKELLDNNIKTSEEITELFGLPVLGVVPDFSNQEKEGQQ